MGRPGDDRAIPRAAGGLRVAFYEYLRAGCGPFGVSRLMGAAGPNEERVAAQAPLAHPLCQSRGGDGGKWLLYPQW